MSKNQAIKAVLTKRISILEKAIAVRKKLDLPIEWLKGKLCGYEDALDLLRSSEESIRIEL